MTRHLIAFLAVALVFGLGSLGSVATGTGGSIGGGSGSSGGMNGNPSNPANWNISYVYDGEDRISLWEWNPIAQVYEQHLYTRSWPSLQWYRDGIFWTESQPSFPIRNENGYEGIISMSSSGEVEIRFQWISPFPKPAEVPVTIHSSAFAQRGEWPDTEGTLSATNGLGDPPVLEDPYIGLGLLSNGTHLRRITVDGAGLATYTVSKTAYATEYGYMAGVEASAQETFAAIDDREVFVFPLAGRAFTEPLETGIQLNDQFGFSYPEAVAAPVMWTFPATFSSQITTHCGAQPMSAPYPGTSWLRQMQYIGSATWKGGPATYSYDATVGQGWNGLAYTGPFHMSGSLPFNGMVSPPNAEVSYRGAVEQEALLTGHTVEFFQNDDKSIEEMILRYTWPDGVQGESRALVKFHHTTDDYEVYGVLPEPKESIDKPGVENQSATWLLYNQWVSPAWNYRVPTEQYDLGGAWSGWVSQLSDSYESEIDDDHQYWSSVGAVGVGWVTLGVTAAQLPTVALVTTAAGLIWQTFEMAHPETRIISISRKPELFQKACYLGAGWIYPLPPNWPDPAYFPPASDLTQYNWQAYHRTLHTRLRQYCDVWDDAGFVRRDLAEDAPPYDYDGRQKFQKVVILP